jgi:hypothetical protein
MRDLIISGSATSADGSKGLSIRNGSAVVLENIQVNNFDSCLSLMASGAAGITATINNPMLYQCWSHNLTFDGWPETLINGGRLGDPNQDNAAASPRDMVYFTKTNSMAGGGGPNSITFDGTNLIARKVDCFIRWGGQTGSGGLTSEFRFNNMHLEAHVAGTADFCSDNTVPLLGGVWISNMNDSTSDGVGYRPLFALDPKTGLNAFHMENSTFSNCFYTGAPNMFNLAPLPVSGESFSGVHFGNNNFCQGPTFAANGVGYNTLMSTGNRYGNLTISGAWFSFESSGDSFEGLFDAATGKVAIGGAHPKAWTPTLTFDGTPGTIGYSYQFGDYQRTADGGFIANFGIALSSITGASGNAQIQTSIPYRCEPITLGVGNGSGAVSYMTGMTGLTGAVGIYLGTTASPKLFMTQWSAAGSAGLASSNFTAGSLMVGEFHCAKAH